MSIRDRFAEMWDAADVLDSFWRIWASPYVMVLLLLGLAAVVCLGTLLPQRPVEALSDAALDNLWQASLRARYGGLAEWLIGLRLSDLYRSLWLRGLLGLLALNLLLGVVDLIRPRYRRSTEATEVGRAAVNPDLLLEQVTEGLRGQRYRVLAVTPRGGADAGAASPPLGRDARLRQAASSDEPQAGTQQRLAYPQEGVRIAYADRFSFLPILVYLGLLLVLGALLLSERTAWWEEQIPLRPGQVRPVGHGTGLALRADSIEADYGLTTGLLRGGRTDLTVLQASGPAGQRSLHDHTPSLYAGILFYQMSTEPVLLIQAQDATGRSLALQTPEMGAMQSSEVTLRFREQAPSRFIVALDPTPKRGYGVPTPSNGEEAAPPKTRDAVAAAGSQADPQSEQQENEGYVLVPSRDLSLRLLYVPPTPGEVAPAFQAEAFRGSERTPFETFRFASAAAVEIDGDRYVFQPQRHAVIKFGRDYALAPILVGAVLALVGFVLSVWRPARRLWLTIQPIGNQVSLGLLEASPKRGYGVPTRAVLGRPLAAGSAQDRAAPWFADLVQTLVGLPAMVSAQGSGDASPTSGSEPAATGPGINSSRAWRDPMVVDLAGGVVLLGLILLTVLLLLGAVAQFYSQGVYWAWAKVESLRLVAWLLYAVAWCGLVLLGWRGRRLWVLAALGAVPALLTAQPLLAAA